MQFIDWYLTMYSVHKGQSLTELKYKHGILVVLIVGVVCRIYS
jgi:hypothetical protein